MTPIRFSCGLLFAVLIQTSASGQMIGAGGTQGISSPTRIYEPGRAWLGTGQVFLGDILQEHAHRRPSQSLIVPQFVGSQPAGIRVPRSAPPRTVPRIPGSQLDGSNFELLGTGETSGGVVPAGYPSGAMEGTPTKATLIYRKDGRIRLGNINDVPKRYLAPKTSAPSSSQELTLPVPQK